MATLKVRLVKSLIYIKKYNKNGRMFKKKRYFWKTSRVFSSSVIVWSIESLYIKGVEKLRTNENK